MTRASPHLHSQLFPRVPLRLACEILKTAQVWICFYLTLLCLCLQLCLSVTVNSSQKFGPIFFYLFKITYSLNYKPLVHGHKRISLQGLGLSYLLITSYIFVCESSLKWLIHFSSTVFWLFIKIRFCATVNYFYSHAVQLP